MDAIALRTLASELRADAAVAVAAIDLAHARFAEGSPSGVDSAGHHLSRAYNVIEQMALRVAKAPHGSSRISRSVRSTAVSSGGGRAPMVRTIMSCLMVRRMPVTVDGAISPAVCQSSTR